jgi:hypothetical protein
MAVVYRALLEGPSGFERPVAIKRIRPDLARDDGFRAMLLDEARLSARLQHPNIVQVLECGEVDGELYIAMELLEGCDLRALLARVRELGRTLPVPLCAFFGAQLAGALNYAHGLQDSNGPLHIVHRDLSPTNVMLTNQGAVKLLDFGIAKAAGSLRDQDTRTGVVKGKFSYMSPEQAGGHEVDHRSDLFALGVVITELVTMKQPFRGANDLATLRLVREAQVPAVTSARPGVAPAWDDIMRRLLAVEPSARFQSGAQVERALLPLAGSTGQAAARDFLQALGLGQRMDSGGAPTGSAIIEVSTTDAPLPQGSVTLTASRTPRVLGALAAVALTVTAGLVVRRLLTEPTDRVEPAPAAAVTAPPPPAEPTPEPAAKLPAVAVEPPHETAPVATVVLEVRGPKGARIFIDGAAAGQLPSTQHFPSRPEPRKLRVEKPGFVAFERVVPGDSSVILETSLRPIPSAQKAPVKAAARPASDVPDPFR